MDLEKAKTLIIKEEKLKRKIDLYSLIIRRSKDERYIFHFFRKEKFTSYNFEFALPEEIRDEILYLIKKRLIKHQKQLKIFYSNIKKE